MTPRNNTASPALFNPTRRVRTRWVWLLVVLLGASQLLFIPHEYTHPVLGSDGACKICLLSSSVTPPPARLAPAPPTLFPVTLVESISGPALQSAITGNTHPRAPPTYS
jgi:hypothetical protein